MDTKRIEEPWYDKYTKPDNDETILADMIRINIEMYLYGVRVDRDTILPYVYTMFERDPYIFTNMLSDKLNIPNITADWLMQIVDRYRQNINASIVSDLSVDMDNNKIIQDISISYTTHEIDTSIPKLAYICGFQMKHDFIQKYIHTEYPNPNIVDNLHLLNYRLMLIGYIKPVEKEVQIDDES
jgi:hypothetical protein